MASEDELAALPTPDMITLLFKCHKSTVALSVLPTTPFTEIKSLLLGALQSRNIELIPNSNTPLPEDPEGLEFGVLADKKDANKGWVLMETEEQEASGPQGRKRKGPGKASVLNQTPAGAGLGDGAWIAYRAKSERQEREEPRVEAGDEMEGLPDIDIEEDPGFDVEISRFEEDEAE
jgi:hypothetical protein